MKKNRAFTLIELLIVITIIALLLGIVFVAFGSAKKKGQVAKAEADMNAIVSAMKLFQNEKGKLPSSSDGFTATASIRTLVDGRYLETAINNDPWNNQYRYTCGSGASIIWSCGAKSDSTTCVTPPAPCDGQFCGDNNFNGSFGYVVAPAPSSCL